MRSSKLSLFVLPLLGVLAFGCAAPADAQSASEAITAAAAPADLAAFDALKPEEKVAALYNGGPGLRPGFAERAIRIVDEIPAGPERKAALDAYFELRDYAYSAGGTSPNVYAIAKDGVTYAYAMQASGSYHSGSWGDYVVYDRTFVELTRYSYAE